MDPGHALWIGGPSGSGAERVAAALAEQWRLRLYEVSENDAEHERRMPVIADARWIARHRFRLVLEDLRALPEGPRLIVAGPHLFPTSVAAVLAEPGRALFLLSDDPLAEAYAQEARDLRLPVVGAGVPFEELLELAAGLLASAAGGTSR